MMENLVQKRLLARKVRLNFSQAIMMNISTLPDTSELERKSCESDTDCPSNYVCQNSICFDPCSGGEGNEACPDPRSTCIVRNHQVSCRCDPKRNFVSQGEYCKSSQ